ncbi:proline-rich proteoglycan 2-like isoform X2 [Cygnus olor]|uniref:proline-rich proteoglycan 2-like isoform X2 n=1 Tax=Cygnus olor TaxID=8869 RepID=UPI001ADE764A|nr:proline-rich proteoglycan 2-like isoform X2 [Cygnus olor]
MGRPVDPQEMGHPMDYQKKGRTMDPQEMDYCGLLRDGAPHGPPDGAPHGPPGEGTHHGSPGDGAPHGPPEGTPHGPPGDGALRGSPEDGAPHGPPGDGAPHGPPGDGAPHGPPSSPRTRGTPWTHSSPERKSPPMGPKELCTRWSPAGPGDGAPPGHQEMGNSGPQEEGTPHGPSRLPGRSRTPQPPFTPRRRVTLWTTRRWDSPWPPPCLPEGPPQCTASGPPCFDIFITKRKTQTEPKFPLHPPTRALPPRDARSSRGGAGGGPNSTGTPTRSKGTSVGGGGGGRALWLVPVGPGGGDTLVGGLWLRKGDGGGQPGCARVGWVHVHACGATRVQTCTQVCATGGAHAHTCACA